MTFRAGPANSLDTEVIRPVSDPFDKEGGIRVVNGNLGIGVVKVSAVAEKNRVVEAPAVVFEEQDDLIEAFKRKELNKDFIAVVRYQGPRAKGMPELHKLTPTLSILQQNGYKVALVTDGRMSGASGKVPAAIHLSPEAINGGMLGLIQDGDLLRLDCNSGELSCLNMAEVEGRSFNHPELNAKGSGRELFNSMRQLLSSSETGATIF